MPRKYKKGFEMVENKSDLKRFCETMWVMTKSNVVPWIVCAGLIAMGVCGIQSVMGKTKTPFPVKIEKQR